MSQALTLIVAEVCGRWKEHLQPRGVPFVITTTVVVSGAYWLMADGWLVGSYSLSCQPRANAHDQLVRLQRSVPARLDEKSPERTVSLADTTHTRTHTHTPRPSDHRRRLAVLYGACALRTRHLGGVRPRSVMGE